MMNKKIKRPAKYRNSIGKDIYDVQKKSANFGDRSLKQTRKKKGVV